MRDCKCFYNNNRTVVGCATQSQIVPNAPAFGVFHRQWALRKPSMELVAQAVVLRWQMGWMDTPETEKVIALGVSGDYRP